MNGISIPQERHTQQRQGLGHVFGGVLEEFRKTFLVALRPIRVSHVISTPIGSATRSDARILIRRDMPLDIKEQTS